MKHQASQTNQERIGEFLVRIGAMQLWQLEDVRRAQGAGDQRLFGEIAIELGYIEDSALRLYVESRGGGSQQAAIGMIAHKS